MRLSKKFYRFLMWFIPINFVFNHFVPFLLDKSEIVFPLETMVGEAMLSIFAVFLGVLTLILFTPLFLTSAILSMFGFGGLLLQPSNFHYLNGYGPFVVFKPLDYLILIVVWSSVFLLVYSKWKKIDEKVADPTLA